MGRVVVWARAAACGSCARVLASRRRCEGTASAYRHDANNNNWARFGFSLASLRHRERGNRAPAGPALVLLNVIDKDHKAAMRALQGDVRISA